MRFRFCGDLDAPDWLLAEIATLSKVTAVRMKLLLKQVVSSLLGTDMDYDKVAKLTSGETLSGGASDTKGAVAALRFILSNSAKYDIDDSTLQLEVQQLGLPKENADALGRAFRDSKDSLQETFLARSLEFPAVRDVEWRVDHIIAASDGSLGPEVHLKFLVDREPHLSKVGPTDASSAAADPLASSTALSTLDEVAMSMPAEKFQVLFHELQQAAAHMESLEG
mmetsp:Transcript_6364/g.18629  ORF Transcript_6364/g.18629 Transcript_6364/m.18629 type:complete len:224 (-) Transcript_6364:403-1074(-)|eukprot:CAMPEP_0118962184 /NCGR_PEP_ID=MMETSP1173-20130426/607_1 /TAXON_ID=1034831 /ORGANISM="Rhizochromulina marina cf, Strain CCMP1243" /LENGTH=223 /DNA_ID=CAMNT_0006910413 /DNA_START=50 /DNA_END=721 /DNA_ORIENTATION=+